ncbi:NAD(P)-dependent alcohol dehydrogenase [Candidatus Bipolaricaulota bacterium]|nr:NAD(P)-dependent alcohol dehydrogenase [Candidatus Bipolaricaulota bacterium]
MKAVVWTAYGPPDVLHLDEIEKPAPTDDEVLIRVRATTVTAGDCEMRRMGNPIWYRLPLRAYVGVTKPKRITVLGMELAGDVEAVGKNVTRFVQGDPVFAATGIAHVGTCAEYICLREAPDEGAIAKKPANMSYEEAAAVPVGGLEALHFLKTAAVRAGEMVLVNGAGGTIGAFAVQLAKHFGADVTAVDSGGKLPMLSAIGADHVIDYTREDVLGGAGNVDVIFDVVGRLPFSRAVRSLNRGGRYLTANPRPSIMLRGRWMSIVSGKTVIQGAARAATEDLASLRHLIEEGKLRTIIDRTFPLEQTADAHRYVETGQKIGNVIIIVHPQEETA